MAATYDAFLSSSFSTDMLLPLQGLHMHATRSALVEHVISAVMCMTRTLCRIRWCNIC